ncbi:MAG: hypothetical protein PHG25_00140 [Candidatus Pacebacteria bacterium]|nr:hypothetical protein [Candidatus Paceibacterota bacterium]
MKNKHIVLLLTALIISGGISTVSARGLEIESDTSASGDVRVNALNVSTGVSANARLSDDDDNDTEDTRSTTSIQFKNKGESRDLEKGKATSTRRDSDDDDSASSTRNGRDADKASGAEHRSVVSAFVRSLLSVADREGGIGAQVRAIAMSQNDSASTTVSAMTKVDNRGSLRTFFFGSDYKNLGKIRAGIASTTQALEDLKALLSSTISTSDRTEISLQISALQAEQVRLQAYVKAHEDKFSLFGWINKDNK